MKITLKVSPEYENLVNDLLTGKVLPPTGDRGLIRALSHQLAELRRADKLLIARDDKAGQTIFYLNGRVANFNHRKSLSKTVYEIILR